MTAVGGRLKKILILAGWYEPGYQAGGPIQSVKNFVAAMQPHYELFIVTGDRDLGDKEPYPGIPKDEWVSRPPGVSVFYTETLTSALFRQLLKQLSPDFIYLNSMYSFRYAVMPLVLLGRNNINAKVILSPRGMLRASAVKHKSFKKKPFLAVMRVLHIPERILFHATDEQERDDIRTHFPRAGSISLIPNFSAGAGAEPELLEKIPGQLKCVFIGRIMDIKNLAFFTSLLRRLPIDVMVEFSIYGSVENENYWSSVKETIAAFPSNIRASFHGPVPHAEVRAVLDRHHLFVLPTRGENFGHAIFEAFLAGRPVLISDKTPWRGLETNGAGWDLSLDETEPWTGAVITAAGWSQVQFESHVNAAFELAKDYQRKTDLTSAYQQLFS